MTEPTRRIDELKALNRQGTPLSRSPNHSFSRDTLQISSPLRERFGGPLLAGHVQSSSLSTDRRYQSPIAKARDKFDSFYESLKSQGNPFGEKKSVLDRIQTIAKGQLPPRSPTNFDARLQNLSVIKRSLSPPRRNEELAKDEGTRVVQSVSSLLPLDQLRQVTTCVQRNGLTGVSATYESELRALAKLVLGATSAEEQPS